VLEAGGDGGEDCVIVFDMLLKPLSGHIALQGFANSLELKN
jgi:hypothetical protein